MLLSQSWTSNHSVEVLYSSWRGPCPVLPYREKNCGVINLKKYSFAVQTREGFSRLAKMVMIPRRWNSYLGHDTDCSDWGFLWFSSVLSDQFWDTTFLPHSFQVIIHYPVIWCCIVSVTGSFIKYNKHEISYSVHFIGYGSWLPWI
jgi:hypothetical protein